MNKNFKKHLEASYTRAFEECARTGHKVGDLDAIFNSIAMATFAELIVKECTGICESMQLLGPYKDVQDSTLKDAAIQIKEHFGVKE
jgi:hypothetical protein